MYSSELVLAQSIYVWTDEEGHKHYSTTPDHPGSVPSNLPQIQRENIEKNIQKLKAETPPSCDKHGGVDCSAGADSDGSVICRDDYRNAKLPFRFECLEARLKSEFFLKVEGEEKRVKHSQRLGEKLQGKVIQEIYLSTRNLSGVQAFGIKAEIRIAGRAPYPLQGPETIDAYGQSDYLVPPEALTGTNLRDIEQARYKISCTNCGSTLGVN